jgi:hypothetical protein
MVDSGPYLFDFSFHSCAIVVLLAVDMTMGFYRFYCESRLCQTSTSESTSSIVLTTGATVPT